MVQWFVLSKFTYLDLHLFYEEVELRFLCLNYFCFLWTVHILCPFLYWVVGLFICLFVLVVGLFENQFVGSCYIYSISCLWNRLEIFFPHLSFVFFTLLRKFGVKSKVIFYLCCCVNIKARLFSVVLKHMLDL